MTLISHILSAPGNILEPSAAKGVMNALINALSVASDALESAYASQRISEGNQAQRAIILWTTMQGLMQVEKLQRHDAESFEPLSLYNAAIDTLILGWGCPPLVLQAARQRHTHSHTLENNHD